MSLLYPDKIKVVQITMDVETKVTKESLPLNLKAYVEVENRILYGWDGSVIRSHTRVYIPNRRVMQNGVFKRFNLNKGDMLTFIKINGETPAPQDRIRHPILMVTKVGAQRSQHIELIV